VQLGENFYGPRDLFQALAAGAGDYVMPDLMRIGGVSGWLRAAPIAAAAGVEVSTHLYPEVAAHLLRVTETAHWLEWQDWADPIVAEPFPVRDGQVMVPDRPGNGLAWNEDAVKRYRYDV
jgi:mandelate racemase